MPIQEEEAEVELLYSNLDKVKLLTKKIDGCLSRINTNTQVIQDAIGPIHRDTQDQMIIIRNVDRINEVIERMRKPLDTKGQEESILRAGPRSAGLPQYLAALKRVQRALSELSNTNLRSNQQAISELTGLLSAASGQLQDTFRSVLGEAKPVEPLYYITKQLPFPPIPDDKVPQLNQIASALGSIILSASQENPAGPVFVEVRGSYLTMSLQNLATASINTSKRRGQEPYKVGSSGIGAYASGMEGMFVTESENITKIFPPADHIPVLESTTQGAVAEFTRTVRELDGFIKANIMSDCFLAYEIIDIVAPLSFRLEQKTGTLRSGFSEALRPIRETAKSSLPQLLDETRRRASTITMLPNDGAPVPIVSETMARLGLLATFSTPLSSILSSLGDGNWRSGPRNLGSPALDVGPDSFTLMANYLLDFIMDLFTTLESRAKTFHRTKSLQGCFLANCMSIIDRCIRSSPELSRYLNTPPHSTKLDPLRKKGPALYGDAWRDCSRELLEVQYTNRAGSRTSGSMDSAAIVKSLSSKDRDGIKLHFKNFTAAFDELVARHKSLNMEKDVRTNLSKEVQVMIEPLYNRFWDRYHEIDKKGKTVKYSKADFAAALASLS